MAEKSRQALVRKIARVSTWAMAAVLFLGSVWFFAVKNIFEGGAGLASLLVYLWFQFGFNRWSRRPLIRIPAGMSLVITLTALTSVVLGRFLALYKQVSWFDKVQHLQFGMVFCLFGLVLFYRFNHRDTAAAWPLPGFVALSATGFSHLCCFGWELYEYAGDRLFGTNMQAWKQGPVHGLLDTMNDLAFGLAGAVLIALAAYGLMKRNQARFFRLFIAGFMPADAPQNRQRKQDTRS